MKIPSKFLCSTSQNQISFQAFFAILSFHEQNSSFFSDIILSLIEYLQLVSQIILINFSLRGENSSGSSYLFVYLFKLFNFRSVISFGPETQKSTLVATVAILLLHAMLKYGLFVYIIICSFKRNHCPSWLLAIWRWVFRTQGKVIFFVVSSIWLNIFHAASEEYINVEKIVNYILIVVSVMMTLFEFLSSFYFCISSYYPVPTKNFMSAKSKTIDVITLLQKFIILILETTITSRTLTTAWVLISTSLAWCLIRDLYYIQTLPHYRLKALLFQSSLLMIVTSLNLASFADTAMRALSSDTYTNFIVFTWMLLTLLSISSIINYIKRRIFGLVGKDFDIQGEWLLHKFIANDELFALHQTPSQLINRYSFSHLLNMTEFANIKSKSKSLGQSKVEIDINSKQSLKRLVTQHIEGLLTRFPGNPYLKLYAGYYYAKKLKQYSVAMRILTDLRKFSSRNIAFSASLLVYSLQQTIISRYKANSNRLDLYAYIRNIGTVAELKAEMGKQTDLHINVGKEFNKNVQDLGLIFEFAQQIEQKKKVIEKQIKRMFEVISESYLEPLLLVAYYYLELNHSLSQYLHYSQTYARKAKKYEKSFKMDSLCSENLYQNSNRLMIISGDKKDLGKVVYSSQALSKAYGQMLTSRHVCSILHPFIQNRLSTLNHLLEHGETNELTNIFSTWTYSPKDGCLYPLHIHMDIHPFLSQGLYYIIIGRLSKTFGEKIIIKQNGDIIGYTKGVGNKLGLSLYKKESNQTKELNISFISDELAKANQAFSMLNSRGELKKKDKSTSHIIQFGEKPIPRSSGLAVVNDPVNTRRTSLGLGWDMQICLAYGSEGANLELQPVAQSRADSNTTHSNSTHTYHCKMESKSFGSVSVQIVTLYEVQMKKKQGSNQLEGKSKEKTEPREADSQVSSKSKGSSEQSEEDNAVEPAAKVTTEIYNFPTENKRNNNLVTTEQELYTTNRRLVRQQITGGAGPTRKRPRKQTVAIGSSYLLSPTRPDKTNWDVNEDLQEIDRWQDDSSSSRKQKGSRQLEISKAFENAVNTKYYPCYYRLYLVLLYGLVTASFIIQAVLTATANSNIIDFRGHKEVIRISEARNDMLVKLNGIVRSTWVFAAGLQDETKYPDYNRPPMLFFFMQDSTNALSNYNHQLVLSLDALTDANKQLIFQKNVRMIEFGSIGNNNTVTYLNSIQATQRVIETAYRAITLGSVNVSKSLPELNKIVRNALNDLLVQNEATTDVFLKLSLQKRDIMLEFTTLNLAISLVFLIFILLLFIVICYMQYSKEKQNMLAFNKLNKNQVGLVFNRVAEFKVLIEDESGIEKIKKNLILGLPNQETIRTGGWDKQKEVNRKPNHQRIDRKYQWHAFKLTFLVLLLSALVLLRYIIIEACVNDLLEDLSQMYFLDRLRTRVHLGFVITTDLTSTNNSYIRNKKAVDQFLIELDSITAMNNNIAIALKNKDSTYDDFARQSLFEDSCLFLKTEGFLTFCSVFKKGGEKFGLVSFISSYTAIMTDFYADYQQTNKTLDALVQLEFKTYNDRLLTTIVLVDAIEGLSNTFDKGFENNILRSQTLNYLSSTLILVSIVAMCLLVRFRVLSRIREAENDFRKVLKILPPRIVLSNFVFKSYLLKTSKRALDSVKSEI